MNTYSNNSNYSNKTQSSLKKYEFNSCPNTAVSVQSLPVPCSRPVVPVPATSTPLIPQIMMLNPYFWLNTAQPQVPQQPYEMEIVFDVDDSDNVEDIEVELENNTGAFVDVDVSAV
jgi:hypothetical protein